MLRGALLAGLVSVTFFAAVSRAEDDKNKCTIAKGESDVAKACQAGGIKRAKMVMKAMQKKAKEKGMKVECDDCHKDESSGDWTLTKEGEEKFKKMAALAKE
jgi:hypothetical protein